MAAFSYQELPFLVDCVLTPDILMKLSSSSSSSTITSPLLSPSCCFSEDQQSHLLNSNSNYFEPIFHGEQLQYQFGNFVNFHPEQFKPIDFSLHEISCVEQGIPLAISQSTPVSSDNEASVTPKQSSLNGGGGGGGTQNRTPVNNKRKPKRDGSSPNPSKGLRGGRSKKQKKSNNEGVKKEEEEEDQKKTSSPSPTATEEAPKGYIHVRARRGQATDSHSLAERARREKISERMKLLRALVPGCDKVTGKATMLDEIINYVRSLQTQVDFLSMKLTSLNPMVYNFGLDLDALLLGQQVLNNTVPTVSSLQQCNQSTTNPTTETPPTCAATATATTGMPTLFQQQGQRGATPLCLEDVIGSLYCGLGDQGGPDPVNQPGFCNNNNNMMY